MAIISVRRTGIVLWRFLRSVMGNFVFHIKEKPYPLVQGEFMIVNSNEVHSVHSPKPNQTIVLQIPIRLFENYFTGEGFIWFTHNPVDRDERLMELIRQMYEVYIKNERGYEMEVKGLFYLVMHLLVSEYQRIDVTEAQLRDNKNLNRLSTITSYIKENYASEMTLESLAKTFLDILRPIFQGCFRNMQGVNFKAYLQDIRLRYAWKEVKDSDKTLSEIAMENGFPNSKALARSFQQKIRDASKRISKKREVTVHNNKEQEIDIK